MVGGLLALGYAGFMRGVGRFAIYVGVERGLVVYMLEGILTRTFALMRRSDRVDGALDRSEDFLKNLPLASWEEAVKKGTRVYVDDEDALFAKTGPRAFVGRHLRRFVSGKIEVLLLTRVRAQVDEDGGGGVSMERVQVVAHEEAEDLFEAAVLGAMNANTLMFMGVLVAGCLVAPLTSYGLMSWQ